MAEMKKGQLRELSALLFFSLASFIVLATNSTLNASQLDGLNSTLDDLTDLSTLPTVNLTGKIDVFARVSFDLKTNATGLLIGLRMDNGTAIRDWVELSLEWNFNHSAENMSGLYQTPAYFSLPYPTNVSVNATYGGNSSRFLLPSVASGTLPLASKNKNTTTTSKANTTSQVNSTNVTSVEEPAYLHLLDYNISSTNLTIGESQLMSVIFASSHNITNVSFTLVTPEDIKEWQANGSDLLYWLNYSPDHPGNYSFFSIWTKTQIFNNTFYPMLNFTVLNFTVADSEALWNRTVLTLNSTKPIGILLLTEEGQPLAGMPVELFGGNATELNFTGPCGLALFPPHQGNLTAVFKGNRSLKLNGSRLEFEVEEKAGPVYNDSLVLWDVVYPSRMDEGASFDIEIWTKSYYNNATNLTYLLEIPREFVPINFNWDNQSQISHYTEEFLNLVGNSSNMKLWEFKATKAGIFEVSAQAVDSAGRWLYENFTLTVNEVDNNKKPEYYYMIDPVVMEPNTNFTINLTDHFRDDTPENMSFWAEDVPNLSFFFSNWTVTIVPDPDFQGIRLAKIHATDGEKNVSSGWFKVKVFAVPDEPTLLLNLTLPKTVNYGDEFEGSISVLSMEGAPPLVSLETVMKEVESSSERAEGMMNVDWIFRANHCGNISFNFTIGKYNTTSLSWKLERKNATVFVECEGEEEQLMGGLVTVKEDRLQDGNVIQTERTNRFFSWEKTVEFEGVANGTLNVGTKLEENRGTRLEVEAIKSVFALNETPEFDVSLKGSGKEFRLLDGKGNEVAGANFSDSDGDGLTDKVEWKTDLKEKSYKITLESIKELNATVIGPDGKVIGDAEVVDVGFGKFHIKFNSSRGQMAGLYKLVVGTDSTKQEYWFKWGLVSVNTRKSIYRPGEVAEIIMVVLDKDGHLRSEAQIELTITNPNKEVLVLSTNEGVYESSKGVYRANYPVEVEGKHLIHVDAKGGMDAEIDSHFMSKEHFEFDIIRDTPVTIDPSRNDLESSIQIISFTDAEKFNFREVLPSAFDLIDDGGAEITEEGDTKILEWVNLTNNSVVSYEAEIPKIWPYLYMLGPAEVEYENGIFKEARQWHFAVDPGTWTYTGWKWRKPINVSETAGEAWTQWPVKLTVNTSAIIAESKMRGDCGDIRFTNYNDEEIPFWFEDDTCNTTETNIWLKMNFTAYENKTVFMYYGNPTASSESNITAVVYNNITTGNISTQSGVWRRIEYGPYEDPVVVGTVNTFSGYEALVFEATNVTETHALVRFCESDGPGTSCVSRAVNETVGFVVAGSNLNDEPNFECGTFNVGGGMDATTSTNYFNENFGSTPYLFFAVQTDNDGDHPVESWLDTKSSSQFAAGICRQDATDTCDSSHATETVGWIAIIDNNEPFTYLDSDSGAVNINPTSVVWQTGTYANTVSNPIAIAEIQENVGSQQPKIDEADNVGTNSIDVNFCEIDSGDTCNSHSDNDVAWWSITKNPTQFVSSQTTEGSEQKSSGPEVNITLPDGSENTIEVLLNFTVQDGEADPIKCWYSADNSGKWIFIGYVANDTYKALNVSGELGDSHFITVRCEDNVSTPNLNGTDTSASWKTPYFESGWGYRIPINISENSGENLTEFQIMLRLNTTELIDRGIMQSDCQDIRITNQTDDPIPYYVEPRMCNNDLIETIIWVQVPWIEANKNNTIYLYHGQVGQVTTTGDESEVFNYTTQKDIYYPVGQFNAELDTAMVAFQDNTQVTIGSWSTTLDAGESITVLAANHTRSTAVNTTGPLSIDNIGDDTGDDRPGDTFVPKGWQDVSMGFAFSRNNNTYWMFAPYEQTNATLYQGASDDWGGWSYLEDVEIDYRGTRRTSQDPADDRVLRMNSTAPLLVFIESFAVTSGQDQAPGHLPDKDLYGLPSRYLHLGALLNDTKCDIYFSDDVTKLTVYMDEGMVVPLDTALIPNDGGQAGNVHGDCASAHIMCTHPVAAIQTADADGTDITTFLPEYELSREYFIPQEGEYLTIVTITPNTKCTLYGPNGGAAVWSDVSDSNIYPYPSRLYYGYSSSGMISAGSRLFCNASVYAYYETDNVGDEHNLLPIKAARQATYPAPTYTYLPREQVIPVFGEVTAVSEEGTNTGGWGETWNFSVEVYDPDNQTLTIKLWYSNFSTGPWEFIESRICENCGDYTHTISWENISFSCANISYPDYLYYFFNTTDPGFQSNQSIVGQFRLEEDDIIIEHFMGNNTYVNRTDTEPGNETLLVGRLNDTDANTYGGAGVDASLWITTDGSFLYSMSATSNATGHLKKVSNSGYLNPGCSAPKFEAGPQKWYYKVLSSADCYQPAYSENFTVTIIGNLYPAIDNPTNDELINMGNPINFQGTLSDDCNTAITSGADVDFVIMRKTDGTRYICDASYSSTLGKWNCTWDTSGQPEAKFNVTMNATMQYYNPGEKTVNFTTYFPPAIDDIWVNASSIMWGNTLLFRVNVSDSTDDTLNVTFLLKKGTGEWFLQDYNESVPGPDNTPVYSKEHSTAVMSKIHGISNSMLQTPT